MQGWDIVTKNWQLILAVVLVAAAIGLAIWSALKSKNPDKSLKNKKITIDKAAEEDVERIFNDTFREELRNRGRLHFEKILNENAMFLQQDLRLTTSQLNEYMKGEITKTLKEEFTKYEASIEEAKKMALETIEKTQDAIEQQREVLGQQLAHELSSEKARSLKHFEENMADIINHYVMSSIGTQIDLSEQLEFILSNLEANKQAIIEDIKSGA